jgi:hypothetical protein
VKQVLAVALIIIIAITLFIALRSTSDKSSQARGSDFYVGVTFSSNTTAQAKQLIDKVKTYTNLLVVDSGPVSKNETSLNEICDYAVDQRLHIIAYFGKLDLSWQTNWIDTAKQRWGSYFLGIYFFDEPAGSLLDNPALPAYKPVSYDATANLLIDSWQTMPGLETIRTLPSTPTTFTSDYALYWWDYQCGYDVVLSQFGWNNSREQAIALLRGAAQLQNKSWGAIMTWTYDKEPYLENGPRLYSDMLLAYENGAKYVIVFNYPTITDNIYGALRDEHFCALQQFWNKIKNQPNSSSYTAQNVLVLPQNYGWGMRSPNDRIWGLWGPDEKSSQIWNATQTLLTRYFPNLDIVFQDPRFPLEGNYTRVFYWNSEIESP